MAAKTGQDVVDRVREDLSDTLPDFRWTDPVLLRWVNDIRRLVREKRPEATFTDDEIVTEINDLTLITQPLLLAEDFFNAMVHGVTYRALMKDGEDSPNAALAETHWKHFIDCLS